MQSCSLDPHTRNVIVLNDPFSPIYVVVCLRKFPMIRILITVISIYLHALMFRCTLARGGGAKKIVGGAKGV